MCSWKPFFPGSPRFLETARYSGLQQSSIIRQYREMSKELHSRSRLGQTFILPVSTFLI